MTSACAQRTVSRRPSASDAVSPLALAASAASITTADSAAPAAREFAAKAAVELIDLAAVDTCVRVRAARVVWRMDTFRKRGEVTERQYNAAADLMALLIAGNDRTQHVMSQLNERADQSRRPIVARLSDGEARRQFRRAMECVGRIERVLINAIVFGNGDITAVVESGALCRLGTPISKALRKSAMDLLKNALDNVSDHFESSLPALAGGK